MYVHHSLQTNFIGIGENIQLIFSKKPLIICILFVHRANDPDKPDKAIVNLGYICNVGDETLTEPTDDVRGLTLNNSAQCKHH